MTLDRLLLAMLVSSALLAGGLGAAVLQRDADREWSARTTWALDAIAIADQSLRREVLSARVGLSRNYDEMNRSMTTAEAAMGQLTALSARLGDLAGAISALSDGLQARHAAVERFKTDNALLQNALARFASLSEAPSAPAVVGGLPALILRLTLDTSPDVIQAARDELRQLEPNSSTRAAAVQADLLVSLLPAVDDILRMLSGGGVDEAVLRVQAAIARIDGEARTRRDTQALLLAGAILACLACGGVLSFRAFERHRRLRWHGDNEHLRATVAGLLLAPDKRDVDARIIQVLQHLATHAGVARVVVALDGGPPVRVLAWPPIPDHEGQRLAGLIDAARTSASWTENVATLPPSDGDGHSLLLLRDGEPGHAVLGIDADPSSRTRRPELFAGLTIAMSAIVQAIYREAADAERLALERRLADAERLEAIGAIASGVAHNFNNVLGAIGGFSELARARVRRASIVAGYLDEIGHAVTRARKLIDDILGFARRGSVPSRRIRLSPLLEETERLLRASLPAETPLTVRVEPVDEVIGDAARLQQVFMNLCNNAAAAAPGGSMIVMIVSGRGLKRAERLSHGALAAGDYLVVAVSDEGPGVPRAILPRLFEPFFTTRPCGTGLGLSTAWQIVRDHGGTINVALPPEGGSTFEVWLPRAPVADPQTERPLGGGERVLLLTPEERAADDEIILAGLGYEPVFLSYAFLASQPGQLLTTLAEVDAVLAIDPPASMISRLGSQDGSSPPLIVASNSAGAGQVASAGRLRLPLREDTLGFALGAALTSRPR